MRVLLTGATGFIGSRLRAALAEQGHELRCVSRRPPASASASASASKSSWVALDFSQALSPEQWTQAVAGCDVVINTTGVFRSRGADTLDRIHGEAPRALFDAARRQGVERIIHLSALGADEQAGSAYHRSKKAGDDALRQCGVPYTILQPSLVFGPDGASSRFFMMMASLPVIPLPGGGDNMVQPVHVDDLVQAVLALLSLPAADMPEVLPVIGPTPLPLRAYYATLRAGMDMRHRARFLPIPLAAMRPMARMGDRLGFEMLNSEAIGMLARGNTGDPRPLRRLLGRSARAPAAFIDRPWARPAATQARAAWLLPLLRWSIALVWLLTACVSAFGYPIAGSYALLDRAGVPGPWQPPALYGAIVLDLLLGICVLLPRRPRWIWAAQAALMLGYTAIISLRLPEYWLHPYGPLLKNLPMLAALWLLGEMDDPPRGPSTSRRQR
ncbi:NAD(P)-binding domain-containing protein [Bordetella sputigena]|uniref:NAD(P)H-binding protein n=1 Tax=Bordetella sputigena TaxID=1416810 RepID=UPI0039EF70E1